MKRIRKLSGRTPGLDAYLNECQDGDASWDGFRNHSASGSYRELVETLDALQRGLCGYCEIDLTESDRQVEHVIPRSDPNRGSVEALNPGNTIACCLGGAARNLHGPDADGDEERFRQPAKRNLSCGQAKAETNDPAFFDPRTLPLLPSVTKVLMDGRIEADSSACAHHGENVDRIDRTIARLGLNVERLRLARQKRWRALNRNWSEYFDDRDVMKAAARSVILPQSNGHLPRFFTTSRSYFAPYGEGILHQDTRRWV